MDRYALGRLCLERRILTEEQLERCLEIQRTSDQWRRLGEILLTEGLITGVALANLLSIQETLRRTAPAPAEPPARAPAEEQPRNELGWLLKEARSSGATSVVLCVGNQPAVRMRGRLERLDGPPIQIDQLYSMIVDAVPDSMVQELDTTGYAEATHELGGEQVRVTLYRTRSGMAASLTAVATDPPALKSLGLPTGVRDLTRATSGLILVTGPAGCGKSTTLAALLEEYNRERECHILLIEKPKELSLHPKKAMVTHREVGSDTKSFAAAIRAGLSADADIIALSDLRSTADIAAALDAAQAGRLVIGSMYTMGAGDTVRRILDALGDGPKSGVRDALATTLRGILSQRLFATRRERQPAVAAELFLGTPHTAHLLREKGADEISHLLRTQASGGMISLEESLARVHRRGSITLDDALAAANDTETLRRALGVRRDSIHVGR